MLKHKRLVSIIATIAFCLSFLAPAIIAPAPAVAAGSISILNSVIPTVATNTTDSLATIKVTVPAGAVSTGDVIILNLPDKCELEAPYDNSFRLVAPENIGSDNNGLYDKVDVDNSAKDQIRFKANGAQELTWSGVFYIYLDKVKIGKAAGDELIASLESPKGFPAGDVVVGKTTKSSGKLTLNASQTETANDDFKFKLTIKEELKGSLKLGAESVELTLPDGFVWKTRDPQSIKAIWGNDTDAEKVTFAYSVNKDELAIRNLGVGYVPASGDAEAVDGKLTTKASAWEIEELEFTVSDESRVEPGDIVVKVTGESNIGTKELVVGKYGDFGVEITCDETPEVFAGKLNQKIGDFTIEETIGDSLIQNRNITLTLPSYAKWTKIKDVTGLKFDGVAGSDGNVLKYKITDETGNGANDFDFEDFEVALDVTAPGDLTVTVGGNAGIEAEVVVAKVTLPVIMKAENATEVKIGAAAQKIADLTITESVAEAIAQDKELWLKVPAGCEWATIPTIAVESGDLKLDLDQVRKAKAPAGAATTDYYQFIIIPVDRDSNEPSVIKVTDCYVTVDRTVPEGTLTVGLLGSAVLESNIAYGSAYMDEVRKQYPTAEPYPLDMFKQEGYRVGTAGMFPQTAAIAGAAAAKVVTPSQGSGVVSFYIGSQVYTVNGIQKFMDVAPFIKADRTYVPVRFLSEALGADVAWDEATKTVTVTKGDKTVVLVIGSTIAKVNGADVQMDVAPEIAGVGRTMLPARWVAEGLGYQVGWIPTVKQVVIQ